MKINVDKLDATIQKLQELRRLATDPALAAFVQIKGRSTPGESTNGNGAGHGRGRLKTAVLEECKQYPGTFTAQDLFARLDQGVSENPKSVANALKSLASDGTIRIVEAGKGRRPTKYAA